MNTDPQTENVADSNPPGKQLNTLENKGLEDKSVVLKSSVSLFADSLRESHAVSTRYRYTNDVRNLLRYLGPDATEKDFTAANIRRYLKVFEEDHGPSHVRTRLYALRCYGRWLVDQGFLLDNPAKEIAPVKLGKPHRITPTEAEVGALVESCEKVGNGYRRALARAVVKVLAYSGIRRCEILPLRLSDVDFADESIEVRHGKGDKPRTVFPTPECMEAIKSYVAMRPKCECKRLFLLRRNVPMGDVGLRTLLRDLFAIAGITEARSKALLPHGLRHGCATNMDRNGYSLYEIKETLGHSDIKTTALYLHTDPNRLRELAKNPALRFPASAAESGNPPAAPVAAPSPSRYISQADFAAVLAAIQRGENPFAPAPAPAPEASPPPPSAPPVPAPAPAPAQVKPRVRSKRVDLRR